MPSILSSSVFEPVLVDLPRHQPRGELDDVGLQPEVADRLRGLQAEQPAADHRRRRRLPGVGEDRLRGPRWSGRRTPPSCRRPGPSARTGAEPVARTTCRTRPHVPVPKRPPGAARSMTTARSPTCSVIPLSAYHSSQASFRCSASRVSKYFEQVHAIVGGSRLLAERDDLEHGGPRHSRPAARRTGGRPCRCRSRPRSSARDVRRDHRRGLSMAVSGVATCRDSLEIRRRRPTPDPHRAGLVGRLSRLGVEDRDGQPVGRSVVHGQEEVPRGHGRGDERPGAGRPRRDSTTTHGRASGRGSAASAGLIST